MPFRRPNRSTWYVTLRTPGGSIRKSTETVDKKTAQAIERCIRDLEHHREWELLNAAMSGRITIGQLYDAARHKKLDDIRQELDDQDLEPFVDKWLEADASGRGQDTINHYRHAVRKLIPADKPFARSRFTPAELDKWVSEYPGSAGTKLKARAAMSQFAKFLVRRGVIKSNPMRDVQRPATPAPRLRYLEASDMKRLADAQPEPFRTFSALIGGTGIDVSDALRLKRRDVDLNNREIRAAGTKTHSRDRIVRVAEWAWPYVKRQCARLHPDAPLFTGIDRWTAGDAHRAACEALAIEDYRQKDQRHSYAVRAMRAGTPAEIIARQMGHVDAIMVLKVYGRFAPSQSERDRWERIAAAQDKERAKAANTKKRSVPFRVPSPKAPKNEIAQPIEIARLASSRGGTRTLDPGIMSAVL